MRILIEREAHVRVHDPVAVDNARRALEGWDLEFSHDPYEMAKGADALMLVTAWPQYRRLNLKKIAELMRTPVFFDGRNLFDPDEARRAGLIYMGIGR